MRRRIGLMLALLLLAGGLAGCGKKGDPAPPDPAQNTYPKSYPKSW